MPALAAMRGRHDRRAVAQRLRDDARWSPARSTACRRARRSQPSASARPQRRRRGSRPCLRRRADTRRRARRCPRARRCSSESPGRTTAMTSLSAAIRCSADAAPTGVPAADAVGRGRQRRQQLGAAEARAAAGGEQDADDASLTRSLQTVARHAAMALSVATRSLADAPCGPGHRPARSLGQQPELAVAHDDEHARALVHAVVVRRRHVEHALRADDRRAPVRARRAARRGTLRCRACRP